MTLPVMIETVEMKYDTDVMTSELAHFPAALFHVAATGRHQVKTVISVVMQAIVASAMTV